METYKNLRKLNVTEHVEQKNGLNYLSWAWAWDSVMQLYPEAIYEIKEFEGKPYLYDEKTGYMVFTRAKIENIEREMWLPVMDSNNKAMLDHPYTYDTKYKKDLRVEAATMFDINKTIMRCLVKNLAMFGLGIALYSGEDLPEEELTEEEKLKRAKEFKFETGKHKDKTIEQVFAIDQDYLNWWLNKENPNLALNEMITLVTGMKPVEIPPQEEQVERALVTQEILDLVNKTGTDVQDMHDHFKHKDLTEYKTIELIEARSILEKKVKKC